jgi:hypothetical protein
MSRSNRVLVSSLTGSLSWQPSSSREKTGEIFTFVRICSLGYCACVKGEISVTRSLKMGSDLNLLAPIIPESLLDSLKLSKTALNVLGLRNSRRLVH